MKRRPHFLSSAHRSRRGMTLLEVVIALTIFTTVAFSLVISLNSTFAAASARNQIDMAVRGLDNHLALLHQGRVLPGETDLPDDGTGITYRQEVVPQQMQDQKKQPIANMYQVTITATWKSDSGPEERDVSELIYQP
jgi:prepilin-type N-terminal cleavage/methylation domain-containing protein